MEFLPVFLLAFAVSVDCFSAGLAYGLRNIKIPLQTIFIIALCSATALLAAALVGKYISRTLSPEAAGKIGGSILIILGLWALIQFFRSSVHKKFGLEKSGDYTLLKFEFRSLGIVIHILRKPLTADLDKSGDISGLEALLLGAALSLDAFGAGIGAFFLGIPPFLLAVSVGIMSSCLAALGLKCGRNPAFNRRMKKLSFLPGLLLIIIGLWRM